MNITKRRVTKRNRIKRKYSKKRTKTRHSRKRVFSKKRRKTIKKKKRGGLPSFRLPSIFKTSEKKLEEMAIKKKEEKLKEMAIKKEKINELNETQKVLEKIDKFLQIDEVNKLNFNDIKSFLRKKMKLKNEIVINQSFDVINANIIILQGLSRDITKAKKNIENAEKTQSEGYNQNIDNIDYDQNKNYNQKTSYNQNIYDSNVTNQNDINIDKNKLVDFKEKYNEIIENNIKNEIKRIIEKEINNIEKEINNIKEEIKNIEEKINQINQNERQNRKQI